MVAKAVAPDLLVYHNNNSLIVGKESLVNRKKQLKNPTVTVIIV
jgi:hypothetical protein